MNLAFKQGFEKVAFIGGMLAAGAKAAITNPMKTFGVVQKAREGMELAKKTGDGMNAVKSALPQPSAKFFKGGNYE